MKNWNAALLTLLFLLFITAPAMVMLVSDSEKVSEREKRRLAELEELRPTLESLQAFPAKFEAYFNDHFGLRSTFVTWYSKILVNVFRTSPQRQLVVVGKKDWLFYAGDDEIAKFAGYHRYPEATFDKWKQILDDRQTWLGEQGIHYLFLIAPNKSTIYPEFLPESIRSKKTASNLERFHKKLATPPQFTATIDLQDVLLAAKNQELLYHKSDTHWNLAGAYAAYTAILSELGKTFPELQAVPREQLTERVAVMHGGDMASVINLREQYVEWHPIIAIPPAMAIAPWRQVAFTPMQGISNHRFRTGKPLVSGSPDKSLTAIFISDSFGAALMDYLALHFNKVIRVTDARLEDLTDLIQKEHPDVVIDLIVERAMRIGLGQSRVVAEPMIARQIARSTPTLDLTAANLNDHLSRSEGLHIVKQSEGDILLQATSPDPQLHLAVADRLSANVVSIKCVIDSPAKTGFGFYFKRAGEKDFSDKSLYIAPLEAGENTIVFRIYSPIHLDAFRVDPGAVQGRYRLRQFTLVESPDQQKAKVLDNEARVLQEME